MGAGASSLMAERMEEMLQYSLFVGQTITAISFPGIYSLRDFNVLQPGRRKSGADTFLSRPDTEG